jgi:lipopolysaccharide export system permease protein
MRFTTLDRYMMRETALNWAAVTLVLLLVLIGNRFARFVGVAAAGAVPAHTLVTLIGLSSLQNLIYIIPASQLLAIMLALGRMYRDNEMTAISACGVGVARFYKPFFVFAIVLTVVSALLSLWLGPNALRTVDKLENTAKHKLELSALSPGHFQTLPHGRGIFYAQGREGGGGGLQGVFIKLKRKGEESIIVARRAVARHDPETGQRQFVLLNGRRYQGRPGQGDFRIMRFSEYGIDLPTPTWHINPDNRELKPTTELLASDNPADRAQWQWRLSPPLMVLLVTLLAVPLAYLRPRQGRYAKVILAVLIYVAYANLLGVAQSWVSHGQLSPAIGLWWVHVLLAVLGLFLLVRRTGWRLPWPRGG